MEHKQILTLARFASLMAMAVAAVAVIQGIVSLYAPSANSTGLSALVPVALAFGVISRLANTAGALLKTQAEQIAELQRQLAKPAV